MRPLLLIFLVAACREGDMGWPRPAFAPNVEYGPQLVHAENGAIRVQWSTLNPLSAHLEYREVGAEEWTSTLAGEGTSHDAAIPGYRSGTRLEYRLVHQSRPVTEPIPIRATSATETRFVVLGDSGSGGPRQVAVAKRIEALDPEFVLHTGDIAYDYGTRTETIRRHFVPFADLVASRPWFMSWGNHDVKDWTGGAAMRALFRMPGERYYRIDRGDVRIYSLDTNIGFEKGSEQYRWFQSDLAACDKLWRIVLFHHPPFSGSPYARTFSKIAEAIRRDLCPLFEKHGVQFVFNGHVHGYERAQAEGANTVYVVTGGGGKQLNEKGTAPWTVVYERDWNVCEVVLTKERATLRAVTPEGREIDRFERVPAWTAHRR